MRDHIARAGSVNGGTRCFHPPGFLWEGASGKPHNPPSPHIQVAWDLRLDAYGDFINLASYGKSRPERIILVKARAMRLDARGAFIDLASYGKDRPVSPTLGVQVA